MGQTPSELRGSEESGDEEAMNISKPQLQPATLETWNSFNSLSAEKASDANGNHYQDGLSALNSTIDSESNTEMDNITNKEVWSLSFILTFVNQLIFVSFPILSQSRPLPNVVLHLVNCITKMWKARRGMLLHSMWLHQALPRKLVWRMQMMMMMIFTLSPLHCWHLELCNLRAWKPRYDIVALYRCISDYFFQNW